MSGKVVTPQETNLISLRNYITYNKLQATTQRHRDMAENLAQKIKEQEEDPKKKKKSKPDDLVVLYEKLLQSCQDMSETVAGDEVQSSQIGARSASYKAFRCYYLAESYRYISKWSEAYALLIRSRELIRDAILLISKCSLIDQNEIKKLEELAKNSEATQALVHALGILDPIEKSRQVIQSLQDVKFDPKKVEVPPILERLDQYEAGSFSTQHSLVDFPPRYQSAPCKPILFDLAFNSLSFPSLAHRIKPKKSEKTGFLSRLNLKLW